MYLSPNNHKQWAGLSVSPNTKTQAQTLKPIQPYSYGFAYTFGLGFEGFRRATSILGSFVGRIKPA
jgi:hypothetical protein